LQIPLKEGIGSEGGPKRGVDRVTLWITLMGDVFAVAGLSIQQSTLQCHPKTRHLRGFTFIVVSIANEIFLAHPYSISVLIKRGLE
jgi:hypothetical protein